MNTSQPAARALPPHLLRNNTHSSKPINPRGFSSSGHSTSAPLTRRPTQVSASTPSTASVVNATSPQATAVLIRRVLCPPAASAGLSLPRPWQEQLPPLTSSTKTDEHIYAILAIVIRDFVLTWYSKITPDHQFVTEVVEIVAHCTVQLEARARKIDWIELLGHELPHLIDRHVDNSKIARDSSRRSPFVSEEQAYHALNPHPAFDPAPNSKDPRISVEKQAQNEAAYRQLLVQGVLAVLLPKKDLQNPTLRILVADIVADMILGNAVSGRLCQGWVVWDSIAKATLIMQARMLGWKDEQAGQDSENDDSPATMDTRSALEKSGLLDPGSDRGDDPARSGFAFDPAKIPGLLWRLLLAANYVYLAVMMLISLSKGVYAAASLAGRSPPSPHRGHEDGEQRHAARRETGPSTVESELSLSTTDSSARSSEQGNGHSSTAGMRDSGDGRAEPIKGAIQAPGLANGSRNQTSVRSEGGAAQKKRPILQYAGFSMVSKLLAVRERMPWLAGLLALGRYQLVSGGAVGRAADTDGPIDKYLYQQLKSRLSPDLVPHILRAVRMTVFPENALGPARVVPSKEEQQELKTGAVEAILRLVPPTAIKLYFGSVTQADKAIRDILDVFGDAYCNKHLVFGVVELLVVRLVPELAEKATGELLSEKVSGC